MAWSTHHFPAVFVRAYGWRNEGIQSNGDSAISSLVNSPTIQRVLCDGSAAFNNGRTYEPVRRMQGSRSNVHITLETAESAVSGMPGHVMGMSTCQCPVMVNVERKA